MLPTSSFHLKICKVSYKSCVGGSLRQRTAERTQGPAYECRLFDRTRVLPRQGSLPRDRQIQLAYFNFFFQLAYFKGPNQHLRKDHGLWPFVLQIYTLSFPHGEPGRRHSRSWAGRAPLTPSLLPACLAVFSAAGAE